jgi:hypothetical protein
VIEISFNHWYPRDARSQYRPPTVGQHIAWNHAAWRVVEVRPVPEDRWTDEDRKAMAGRKPEYRAYALPVHVVVRPAELGDDVKDRSKDVHLRHRHGVTWYAFKDAHYAVCVQCREPQPCREEFGKRIAEQAMKQLARYETAGVCPACGEVITARQKHRTFSENLRIPGGPPVTFHVGRSGCLYSAAAYEKDWVAADPKRRRHTLSCPGHVTNHGDGTYDCTALSECPGAAAVHQSHSACRCPSCHANGFPGCYPKPNARRNTGEVTS